MQSTRGSAPAIAIGIMVMALVVALFYSAIFPKRIIAGAGTMGVEMNKTNTSIWQSAYYQIFGTQGRSSCTGKYTQTENGVAVSTCKDTTCEQNINCICKSTGECVERTPQGGSGSCSSIGGVCTDSANCTTKYKSVADATATGCASPLVCCKKCESFGGVCRSNCPTADLMDPTKTYWCSYGSSGYNCCKKTG